LAVVPLSSCATLQQVAALRSVEFQLDRVADVRVAGVDLSQIRTYSDLSFTDAARIGAAAARGELPLSFVLHVGAENPANNTVSARLLKMQWTLLLEQRETVAGMLEREIELPPGQPKDIPIAISLDLLDFFERSGPDLVELALNLAGAGGAPKNVALRAIPTVNTMFGPMTYPEPITIASGTVGR